MNRKQKWFAALVVAALVASLIANVIFYFAAKSFYIREARARLHPTGAPPYPVSGNADQPSILLLGDSRVAQWPLESELFRVTNAGIGNETTAQICLRAKDALNAAKPACVVIESGINDLKTIPLFPGQREIIKQNCTDNILKLVDQATAVGAKVLVLSILPTSKPEFIRRLVWSDEIARAVTSVNQELKAKLANVPNARFLDLTDQVVTETDFVDTLHFTPSFYRKISPMVLELIEAQIKRS